MYPKSHVCIALSLFILPVLSALESHGDLVQSLSWKGDGSLLATSSKVSVKWTTEIFYSGTSAKPDLDLCAYLKIPLISPGLIQLYKAVIRGLITRIKNAF